MVNNLSDYFDFCRFRAMTQQSILHLVVNWEVFTINCFMPSSMISGQHTHQLALLYRRCGLLPKYFGQSCFIRQHVLHLMDYLTNIFPIKKSKKFVRRRLYSGDKGCSASMGA